MSIVPRVLIRRLPLIALYRARLSLLAVILTGGACTDMSIAAQNDTCVSSLADTPMMLLIGTDGLTEVCACAVDSLAVQFPDAGERWMAYQAEFDARVESRGLLGLVVDTAWANSRGKEIGEFAAAQTEIVGACTARLFPQ